MIDKLTGYFIMTKIYERESDYVGRLIEKEPGSGPGSPLIS